MKRQETTMGGVDFYTYDEAAAIRTLHDRASDAAEAFVEAWIDQASSDTADDILARADRYLKARLPESEPQITEALNELRFSIVAKVRSAMKAAIYAQEHLL